MRKAILALCALAVLGATSIASPSVSRKEGKAAADSEALFTDSRPITIKFGHTIEAVCEIRLEDVSGEPTIIANPRLANPNDKTIKVEYHVAFFDKEGKLIGCASQGGTVKPGVKYQQLASCLVSAPASELKKAYSYQIVLYEVEVPEDPK